jgi:predicted Fe-S protein YdhL (DUF1289 family)
MSIESPCINACQMSADKAVCTGCHRSLAEIANWRHLTDAEKLRVIAVAQERRDTVECKMAFDQSP